MPFVDPGDFTPLQVVSETNMDNIRNNQLYFNANLPPIGGLMPYAGASAPAGWLLCDGSAVSRATYAALFAITGSTYGAGNGSTTFNLPDLQFKFPLGKASAGTGSTLGGTGGSANAITVSHNHTQDTHNHSQNSHNHTQDAHGHTVSDGGHAHAQAPQTAVTTSSTIGLVATGSNQAAFSNTFSTASATTGVTVNSTTATNQASTATNITVVATNQAAGSSGTDANLPPYQVFLYIIKY